MPVPTTPAEFWTELAPLDILSKRQSVSRWAPRLRWTTCDERFRILGTFFETSSKIVAFAAAMDTLSKAAFGRW
jgi:hypothetical protein